MNIISLIIKRVGYAAMLLLAVVVLNFILINLAPGDIADTIAGDMGGATAEQMAEIRADYGLDLPLWKQLFRYVSNVLQGDLGYSYFHTQPVTKLIAERLPATLLLVITAQLVALIVGTLLGVLAARKPNGWLSHMVTLIALFGYSAPVFWTGIMLLIVFSLWIPIFPVAGMIDVTIEGGWWTRTLDIARHMVLPVITLSSIFLALYSRLCRASMMEVLGSDYIRTARAKGLSESQSRFAIFRCGLRRSPCRDGIQLARTWHPRVAINYCSRHTDNHRHFIFLSYGCDCGQPADRSGVAIDRPKNSQPWLSPNTCHWRLLIQARPPLTFA